MAAPVTRCDPTMWSSCVFTDILSAFEQQIHKAVTTGVIAEAMWMLQILAAIELMLVCVWWAASDDDQMLTNVFVMGVKIGVFVELLTNLVTLSGQFADGCVYMGLLMGANQITIEQFHDPGAIMLSGWKLFIPVFQYVENLGKLSAMFHLATTFLYGLIALIGWGCIAWIGFNIIVGWLELWLITAYGVALLPFAMLRYTAFIGEGIIRVIIGAGIRMGVLATVLSLIYPILGSLIQTDPTDPSWDTALASLGVAVAFAYITHKIPSLCSKIAGVGPIYTGQGFAQMRNTTVTMVQAGGAMASGGASAAAGGGRMLQRMARSNEL
jgi:type IV secretion system protein TrbL